MDDITPLIRAARGGVISESVAALGVLVMGIAIAAAANFEPGGLVMGGLFAVDGLMLLLAAVAGAALWLRPTVSLLRLRVGLKTTFWMVQIPSACLMGLGIVLSSGTDV